MKALVLCLFAALCAHLGSALPHSNTTPHVKDLLTAVGQAKFADDRSKRDTCDELLTELGGEPYSTCFELLQSVQIDNPDSTEEKVEEYCTASQDCPTNMRNIFQEIASECQGGDPIPELTRTITEVCDEDPRGRYCGDDYISMFDSNMQETYDDCLSDYAGGKGCSSNCDTITEYILNNLGCCYTIVEQYRTKVQGEKEVTAAIFTACRRTEPDPCQG